MSTLLAQLRVAMSLDSAAFEKGAKRSAAEVDALGSKMEKGAARVSNFGKAVFAAGAVIAGSAIVSNLKNIVTQSLEYARTMKEQAQVANASVEQFQKQAYAAKTVGIESEKLSDIFKDVNDRVGEFLQTGGGQMKDFFENIAPKVGVTAEQFRNLSGPDALQLYYTSLEKAGLNQQEMTFYMEAMGDEATKLIPLLRNNGSEMRRLSDDAKRLGVVMSEDMVKSSVEAQQKMESLERMLKGKMAVTVAKNASTIADFTDKLARLAEGLMNLIDLAAKFENSGIGKIMRTLGTGMNMLSPAYASTKALGYAIEAATAEKPAAARAAPKPQTYTAPAGGGAGVLRKTSALPSKWRGWDNAPDALRRRLSGDRPSPFAEFTAGAGVDMEQRLKAITKNAGEAREAMANFGDRTADTAERMATSFRDSADATISALDRVAGAVRGGGFLDILSSVLGLGLQLGSIGLFGKKVASNINATPRAMGGSVEAGRLHLVGEKGPELFVSGSSGRIVPNRSLGGNTYHIAGNLLTPEFWRQIQMGDLAAAQAGASIGAQRMRSAGEWTLR